MGRKILSLPPFTPFILFSALMHFERSNFFFLPVRETIRCQQVTVCQVELPAVARRLRHAEQPGGAPGVRSVAAADSASAPFGWHPSPARSSLAVARAKQVHGMGVGSAAGMMRGKAVVGAAVGWTRINGGGRVCESGYVRSNDGFPRAWWVDLAHRTPPPSPPTFTGSGGLCSHVTNEEPTEEEWREMVDVVESALRATGKDLESIEGTSITRDIGIVLVLKDKRLTTLPVTSSDRIREAAPPAEAREDGRGRSVGASSNASAERSRRQRFQSTAAHVKRSRDRLRETEARLRRAQESRERAARRKRRGFGLPTP